MEQSDRPLLDLLRRHGPLRIEEIIKHLGVTATAVRFRLNRLVAAGLVERDLEPNGRGRPKHAYRASASAQRQFGQNYEELVQILWDEMMHSVPDAKIRRVLFGRVTERLANVYRSQLKAVQLEPRMLELELALSGQGIEAEIARDQTRGLPILRQHSCPYFSLAEKDRDICAMERKMLEKVLGQGLTLSQCRLDGHHFCDFEPKVGPYAILSSASGSNLETAGDLLLDSSPLVPSGQDSSNTLI